MTRDNLELFLLVGAVVLAIARWIADRERATRDIKRIDEDIKHLRDDIKGIDEDITKRMDRAGAKSSTLASQVNGLPTRLDLSKMERELHELSTTLHTLGERVARLEG